MDAREAGDWLRPEEFTIVAPDLPGYGRSELLSDELKPCEPTLEYFELCARVCAKLMAKLGYKTYSLGGWNDGARVASLLAIECQSRVNSLILWGFSPVMDAQTCWATARARDSSSWEPEVLRSYHEVYGEQQFGDLWRHYVDFVVKSLELPGGQFDIRARLNKIKCPTLVLHGSQDPIISFERHVKPIEMQIYDAQLHSFQGLAHNLHQADPKQFNQVLGQFVSSSVVVMAAAS